MGPSRRTAMTAGCLFAAMGAGAAPQEAAEPGTLEEIVVTAQKRSESLQNVPITISVASAQALEQNRIEAYSDLPRLTPGLSVNNLAGYQHIYIRGVGSEFNLPVVNPSVSLYVDGIVQQSSQADPPFLDVDHIEVLKGPQGTLFGRNTPGGAINIISRELPDEFEGRAAVTAGNLENRAASLYLGTPIGAGFKASISGYFSDRDAYMRNLAVGLRDVAQIPDARRYGGRLRLGWENESGASAELMLKYLRHRDGDSVAYQQLTTASAGAAAGGLQTREQNAVFHDTVFLNEYREEGASLTVRIPLENFELVSLTGYNDTHARGGSEFDSTAMPAGQGPVAWFADEKYDHTTSQELQFVSTNDSRVKWLAGLYYFHDVGGYTGAGLHFPFAPGIPVGPPDITQGIGGILGSLSADSYAAFGQARFALRSDVGLTLGGRYTQDKVELNQFRTNFAPPGPGPAETKQTDFSPKVVLDYKPGSTMWYLSASKGYKAGGYAVSSLVTIPLQPEKNLAVEIGAKSEIGDIARIEVALFRYWYEDIQTSTSISQTDPTRLLNAEKASLSGLELSGLVQPTEAFQLSGGISWLFKAEYDEFELGPTWVPNGAGFNALFADLDGNEMVHAPELSGNVAASYEWALPKNSLLRVAANLAYTSSFWNDASNVAGTDQDAYALANASLSYESSNGRWLLSLWGSNLTDKHYHSIKIISTPGILAVQGQPRTYGLTATLNF